MRYFLLYVFICCTLAACSQKSYLFIGGYNDKMPGKGIYVYSFDASTGKAKLVSSTDSVRNPSFFTISPSGEFLYSCTETRTPGAGSVSAFHFDKKTGAISFINKQPSGGENSVYVSLHKSGKWLVMANYTAGNLSVYPVNNDGSLQPFSQHIQYSGRSLLQNQDRSHVHSVVFSPDNNYLFVQDLGLDKITTYHFQPESQKPLQDSIYTSTFPGTGPRHFVFHPNKKFAYLLEEMGGAVVVYNYNNGKLDSVQNILTHHPDSSGVFHSADIHISDDGKFLYASNRTRQDNISIFSINNASGKLSLLGFHSAGGSQPRNFVIDPSGKYLLVANQASNNVVIFKRDKKTGLLTPTGEEIKTPEPSCLKMMKK